ELADLEAVEGHLEVRGLPGDGLETEVRRELRIELAGLADLEALELGEVALGHPALLDGDGGVLAVAAGERLAVDGGLVVDLGEVTLLGHVPVGHVLDRGARWEERRLGEVRYT